MSLDRFKTAQQDKSSGFDMALTELRAARKTSHWIWYVFPQLASLGRSSTARFYGLLDIDEACDYLRDPLLRERLVQATEVVEGHLAHGVTLTHLMGSETDSYKLVSCLTLFELVAKKVRNTSPGVFDPSLEKFSASCANTLTIAGSQGFPRCSHTMLAAATTKNT